MRSVQYDEFLALENTFNSYQCLFEDQVEKLGQRMISVKKSTSLVKKLAIENQRLLQSLKIMETNLQITN